MPLEMRRNENESLTSFLNRFKKAVQKSGILLRAREKMYRDKPMNEREKRLKALRRLEMQKKYELLKKFSKPGEI